jgi:hypothetical protein
VQFYRELRRSQRAARDWGLTVLFYVAVHDIKAFFETRRSSFAGQRVPVTHAQVKTALRATPAWKILATYYETFFGYSKRTRYGCWMPSEADLAKARKLLRMMRREIKSL